MLLRLQTSAIGRRAVANADSAEGGRGWWWWWWWAVGGREREMETKELVPQGNVAVKFPDQSKRGAEVLRARVAQATKAQIEWAELPFSTFPRLRHETAAATFHAWGPCSGGQARTVGRGPGREARAWHDGDLVTFGLQWDGPDPTWMDGNTCSAERIHRPAQKLELGRPVPTRPPIDRRPTPHSPCKSSQEILASQTRAIATGDSIPTTSASWQLETL